MSTTELTRSELDAAVAGGIAAIRSLTRLQPAGGPGDKVYPPTYAVDRRATTRYAFETRRIGGLDVAAVLLDSVASQANRMEEALLAAWDEERLDFPVIAVDFSEQEEIEDLDRITTLQAPHRIADALLRDSLDQSGARFRDTSVGRAFTDASIHNATAVFAHCPTALIFGVWDSTGPKGGLGSKFQRALVSEIVGIGAVAGAKTASRIDPAGIQSNVPVYHRADDRDDWTADEGDALKKKGKLVLFSRKGAEGKGKPSAINHSNVAPSIDVTAGGVTFDYALQTTVLSLPALRRLRFSRRTDGEAFAADVRPNAERAARTALAALALAAVAEARERGYDLRSRSFLVPEAASPLTLELVPAVGGEPTVRSLTTEGAAAILAESAAACAELGLAWERSPLDLAPSPKLAELIRESRRRAAAGEVEASEDPA